MRRSAQHPNRPIDFFVSYSPADERWATWIAWELETAGYSTMLQAWDFVPGTNFIDFMDRGVSEAAVVIAVLSNNYLSSRYGRLEWQAALRADPDDINRLVTIRVADCPLEGLLSMITYVDLVGVTDPQVARGLLLQRIRQAMDGRAKPATGPGYPSGPGYPAEPPPEAEPDLPRSTAGTGSRRNPVTAPDFPPAAPDRATRSAVTVLHLPGPRFGRGMLGEGAPVGPEELQARIYGELTRLTGNGAPTPDLIVVTGDVTESGSLREFAAATEFLTGLRVLLGLEPNRLVVVPGHRDITRPACRAYFASCEADDVAPKPPYWPKWRHFAKLFEELYQGIDELVFDSQQPWTLFPVPDLRVVVAGLNSTIHDSHRDEDHFGWIGETQAAWFAQRLRPFEEAGWLRIGALRHAPLPPGVTDAGPVGMVDNGLLRDTTTMARLLDRRLNLVLHGQPSGTAELRATGKEPALLPPAGPDRCQLLRVSATGVTSFPCRPMDGSEDDAGAGGADEARVAITGGGGAAITLTWRAVTGTFAADSAGAGAQATGPGSPGSGVAGAADITDGAGGRAGDPEPSPVRLLLDRIVEVCQARYDNPRVRLVEGEPPQLLVSHREDGFVRQQRVAAHVGELTQDDLDRFVAQVHAADPDTPAELVYQGPPIPQSVRSEAARRGIRVRSFIEFQGLLDLREFVADQTARLRTDTLYPPDVYVPQRFRELTGTDRAVRRDLVADLLAMVAADEGRFVLLMADFGRGKTFALRELARRIPTELPHQIPILLELRSLEKAQSVEAMVAAHLAAHGEHRIDLKAFDYMLREGRIVLLFDGFDELATRVTYDRAADHLDMVLQAVQGKAKIIISSRSQHFRTDAQVLTALGERVGLLAQRRLLSIEDFSPEQIRSYLGNRYGDTGAADTRLALLSGTQSLLGLSQNPRMLSFIADLDEARLRSVVESGQVISAAALYEEILGAWLAYEEQRTGAIHGAAAGLTRDELWQAVTELAVRLWESNEQYLELADLTEVAETLSTLSEGQLTAPQTLHAVGAGSLLVRTPDGLLGMIHNSVVEWLVAKAIATRLNAGEPPTLLSRRPLSQLTVDFLCDLADTRACQMWLRRVLADQRTDEVTRLNAIKLSTRLRTMARTDLRGAVLRGEDLSYRDLTDADLTGADLTDTRLVGTDLSRAVIRDAVLVGARLDEARLTGADLTGADLSRTRLARADLRDVVVTGSRWRGAALIDVSARAEFFAAPELRGAAVAPGQPVEAQFAPAAIGVSYGFEVGRLPKPVDYSADGQLLAVGSDDGGVLVCDATTGLALRTLHGHRGRVYAVVFGVTDSILVTGAEDRTACVWDPATGERLHRIEGWQDWVWPMVGNPSSGPRENVVATGDSSGIVRLWDAFSGEICHELPGHTTYVWTARFRPDGALLATGDGDGTIRLWDTTTGELRAEVPSQGGAVYRLVFSPDSTLLAAVDHGATVRLYDATTGEPRQELRGHGAPIYAVEFHPDGTSLVSGDTHGSVRRWDVADGIAGGQSTVLPTGRGGAIYWVNFSPGGELLAVGGNDGIVRLLDTVSAAASSDWQPRHELVGHKGSAWPVAYRPDGQQLATSSNDGTTRLWDPVSGQARHVLRGHSRRVNSVAFSSTGDLLATSGNDGLVRLWDPTTGQLRRTLSGIADRLIAAFFDPASALLATPSNDGDVHLWNAYTGAYERALIVDTEYVWAATFSPDGDMLATANDDDTVQLWYRTTGRHVRTFGEHRGRVRSISFSHDGALLGTGCDDRKVRLWDVEDGACLRTLDRHTDRVYAVLFSPDGSRLVTAGHDGIAYVWDVKSGKVRHTLARHTGRLWSAALDPTGSVIATAGDDLVVRLWDAHTGTHVRTLEGHTRRVWSVAFSPDGGRLASAGDDGRVLLWDLGSGGAAVADTAPELAVTLLGLADGWAALAPDGRYKLEGNVTGEFWHLIGTSRFELGDLDAYLPAVRRLPMAAEF